MARENKIRIKFTVNDEEAKAELKQMGQRLEELGGKVQQVGGFLTGAFTLPIAGAFAAAVSQSEELQAALNPIKEEFAGIAAELGNSLVPVIQDLMPDIKKVIGYVSDLVGKFAALDTDSKERILKLAVAIAALGPALSVTGKLIQLTGVMGNLASAAGLGVGAAGAAGGGAAAAGGATAAVTGFGAALTTVVAPLAAVGALAYGLWKILEKIGATKAAGQTLKDLGGIIRYGFGNLITGGQADPEMLSKFTTGGFGAVGWANGVSNFTVPQGYPNDTFLAGLSSGETVNVTPAGRSGGGGTLIVNINAPATSPKEMANYLDPALSTWARQMGWSRK